MPQEALDILPHAAVRAILEALKTYYYRRPQDELLAFQAAYTSSLRPHTLVA
jgi:hypothetical protein